MKPPYHPLSPNTIILLSVAASLITCAAGYDIGYANGFNEASNTCLTAIRDFLPK